MSLQPSECFKIVDSRADADRLENKPVLKGRRTQRVKHLSSTQFVIISNSNVLRPSALFEVECRCSESIPFSKNQK